MDTRTGNYVEAASREEGIAALRRLRDGLEASDVIEVRGTEQQMRSLSRRVQLGSAEVERRRTRRKAQRRARKANR